MHYPRYKPVKHRPPGAGAFFDYVKDALLRAAPTPRSCRLDRRSRYTAAPPLRAEGAQGDGLFFDAGEISGERPALAMDDLLVRLTRLMQSCEGCESVAVAELTRLDAPDPAGCNWSTSVVLAPAGVAPEVYTLAYASVVFMARSSWNLA